MKKPVLSGLSTRIQEVIDHSGGTGALAKKLNYGQARLSNWATGQCGMTLSALTELVKATGCSAHYLLTGEGFPFGPEPVARIAEKPEGYLTAEAIRVTLPDGVGAGDVIEIHCLRKGKR